MVSYEIDGSILIFRASGTTTRYQREVVFEAVRADARVPNGALVLLDVREVDVGMSKHVVVERLRVLLDQLGPKLGPACALIVTAGVGDQARIFQTEAIGFGLRVELFSDERAARQWVALTVRRTGCSLKQRTEKHQVAPMHTTLPSVRLNCDPRQSPLLYTREPRPGPVHRSRD